MTFGRWQIPLGSLTSFHNSGLRLKVLRTWPSGNGLPGSFRKKSFHQDRRKPPRREARTSNNTTETRTCNNCGRKGHLARDCRAQRKTPLSNELKEELPPGKLQTYAVRLVELATLGASIPGSWMAARKLLSPK